MSLTAGELHTALGRVRHAVSGDRKVPVLGCVLLERDADTLRLVSTDRRRLAICELPVDDGGEPFRVLVDAAELSTIGDDPPEVTTTLTVDGDTLHVGARAMPLFDGEFPDYRKLLAADRRAMTLVTDRDAVQSAIEHLDDGEPLQLRFTDGALELGERETVRIPATYAGDDLELHLDADFAHDAIAAVPGSALAIDVISAVSPVVFRAAGDETYTGLVMPVRVRGR